MQMKRSVGLGIAGVAIVGALVLGFLPVGLAYHAVYSIAAAGFWALAIKYAWPSALEAFADEDDGPAPVETGEDVKA